jgi:hypothetical protein
MDRKYLAPVRFDDASSGRDLSGSQVMDLIVLQLHGHNYTRNLGHFCLIPAHVQ